MARDRMDTERHNSSGAKSKTSRATTRGRLTSIAAKRTTEVQALREGGPMTVAETLAALRKAGHIVAVDIEEETDVTDEEDAEIDDAESEISLEDEEEVSDEGDTEVGEPSFILGTPSTDTVPPIREDVFELLVVSGQCSLCLPVGVETDFTHTPLGRVAVWEVKRRYWALENISQWLNSQRTQFLLSRDFWDLGSACYEEAMSKRCPAIQKDFLILSGIHPKVRPADFSRFLRSCHLVWHDGSAPLQILFGPEAKRAWVARAVTQFLDKFSGQITQKLLDEYTTITVPRDKAAQSALRRQPIESMDVPTFVELVNLLAGTRWREVIEKYRNRMVEYHG